VAGTVKRLDELEVANDTSRNRVERAVLELLAEA